MYRNLPANRRSDRRVMVDAMCSEMVGDRQTLAMVLDLSECGLRIARLLRPEAHGRQLVQLELTLPGTGETIWAAGETCFDRLWVPALEPTPDGGGEGPPSTFHTSGIYLVRAAQKHKRLLRDFVVETRRRVLSAAMGRPPDEVVGACAYWSLAA